MRQDYFTSQPCCLLPQGYDLSVGCFGFVIPNALLNKHMIRSCTTEVMSQISEVSDESRQLLTSKEKSIFQMIAQHQIHSSSLSIGRIEINVFSIPLFPMWWVTVANIVSYSMNHIWVRHNLRKRLKYANSLIFSTTKEIVASFNHLSESDWCHINDFKKWNYVKRFFIFWQ